MHKVMISLAVGIILICGSAFATCGTCESDAHAQKEVKGMFPLIAEQVMEKDGVKEINILQFMVIRNSGEKYVLLDVLSEDSYNQGHIPGAMSFPSKTINEETAAKILSKDDNIIVYCGSFECKASTTAAKMLGVLGYSVLDYKGGLQQWQERGNELSSGSMQKVD